VSSSLDVIEEYIKAASHKQSYLENFIKQNQEIEQNFPRHKLLEALKQTDSTRNSFVENSSD